MYKEQQTLESALCNQITNIFERLFLQAMHCPHVGFKNVKMPQFFNHLLDNYGKITDNDLLSNKEEIKQQWDSETPIEILCEQIDDGVLCAAEAELFIPD